MSDKMLDKIEELFSKYKGLIVHEEKAIKITADNTIASYYTNGEICRKKKVPCTIRINFNDQDLTYSLMADEQSYEILGGMCLGHCTLDEVLKKAKRCLERYNFEEKEREQISLF